jgi:hypothetical protein
MRSDLEKCCLFLVPSLTLRLQHPWKVSWKWEQFCFSIYTHDAKIGQIQFGEVSCKWVWFCGFSVCYKQNKMCRQHGVIGTLKKNASDTFSATPSRRQSSVGNAFEGVTAHEASSRPNCNRLASSTPLKAWRRNLSKKVGAGKERTFTEYWDSKL